METTMTTLTTKLGTAKGNPRSRIWIEGQRLIDAGFTAKDTHFIKQWIAASQKHDGALVLTKVQDDDVLTDMPSKVSGKGDNPIIDITGKQVSSFFGEKYSHVLVRFADGVINITGTDNA
jgi:hypothetical protein